MSQWNRTMTPTSHDADEWGNVLVMQDNGMKSVLHWSEVTLEFPQDAWMPLPQSDIQKSVSLTIEVGEVTYTIENNGSTIEVHDSRDPMGQPMCFESEDTITGILEAVDGILQEELRYGTPRLTLADLEGLLEAEAREEEMEEALEHLNSLRGNERPQKPWNKKK